MNYNGWNDRRGGMGKTDRKEKAIIEGNRLIAEFMGASFDDLGNVSFVMPADGIGLAGCGQHAIKYHSSWDWLMPVVEKIEKLGYGFVIIGEQTEIYTNYDGQLFVEDGETKIESVWKVVISFIKWYNQNKEK